MSLVAWVSSDPACVNAESSPVSERTCDVRRKRYHGVESAVDVPRLPRTNQLAEELERVGNSILERMRRVGDRKWRGRTHNPAVLMFLGETNPTTLV